MVENWYSSKRRTLMDELNVNEDIGLSSDEAERLQPYLAVLLKGILPLLKLCNSSLKLEIDEAITRIEKYLA